MDGLSLNSHLELSQGTDYILIVAHHEVFALIEIKLLEHLY